MRKHPSSQLTLLASTLGAVMIVVAGCNGSETSGSSNMLSLPSTGTGSGNNQVNDTAGFTVTVEPQDGVTAYMHKFGATNFAVPCKIAANASSTDLNCIVNMKEEDLYYYGLKLTVNVPRQMCEYLVERPYWYYTLRAGYGVAQTITVNYNVNTGSISSCTATGLTTSTSGAQCNVATSESAAGEVQVTKDGTVTCAYDYTGSDGPNCCEGKYKIIINSTDSSSGTAVTTSQTYTGDYGGKIANCTDGPAAKTTDWPKSKSLIPVGKLTDVRDSGLNSTFEVVSLANQQRSHIVFGANFYDWSTYIASTALSTKPMGLLGGVLVSQTPSWLSYGVDLSGDRVPTPFDAYEYRCEDAAGEILHRIRVYVKDWDTAAAFNTYLTSSGASGSPRTTNPTTDYEGSDCAVGSSVGVGRCDDYFDWDDLRGISTSLFPSEY